MTSFNLQGQIEPQQRALSLSLSSLWLHPSVSPLGPLRGSTHPLLLLIQALQIGKAPLSRLPGYLCKFAQILRS